MRTLILTTLAVLAGLALLLREAAPDAWALPLLVRAALLVLFGIVLVLLARGDGAAAVRRRAGLCVALLLAAGAVRLLPVRQSPERWRASEEVALRDRLASVRTALHDLELAAREVAQEARAVLPDTATCATLAPERRAALFDALSGVVTRPRAALRFGLGLPGVQVFDPHGELVAWAGAPWPAETGTRLTQLSGGVQPVYFRRSGVRTLLSFELRDPPAAEASAAGAAAGDSTSARNVQAGGRRVLVDLPVEIHYRIHNRFLQSRGLAEVLSGDGFEVGFQYDAPVVPPYLTQNDLEMGGDEVRGTQVLALLRDDTGKPLVLARVTGLPYRDTLDAAAQRREAVARWLLVAAVLCGWLAAHAAMRNATSARWQRWAASPLWAVGTAWSVRLTLAGLGLPAGGGPLLSPATFAMVGLGGMLRSTLDLVLTALAFATSAGVLFVYAVRRAAAHVRAADAGPARGAAQRWALPGLIVGTVAAAGVVWLAIVFVGRVAADSNPVLLGPQLDLFSLPVAALHAGLLIMVASWLALAMLAVAAGVAAGAPRRTTVVLLGGLVFAFLVWRTTWMAASAGLVLFVCAVTLRTLLRDDRFTSFGLASFVLVALATTLVSEAVHGEYFRSRQARARETAASVLAPGDDMRQFILDDVLKEVRDEPGIRQRLERSRPGERAALAFEIWAQSMLSRLGTNCEVRVYDAAGGQASEFFVDVAAGPEDPPREMMSRVRRTREPVTETTMVASAAGPVRFHTGAVALYSEEASGEYLGSVFIALPSAPSSLVLAANPRSQAPEFLLNLQEEGAGPRIVESERLLLAWLDGGFVSESSTPYLEVGQAPRVGAPGTWQRLHLVNGDYLVTAVPAGKRTLLAGFRRTTLLDRLLEWAQVGSFSFVLALAGLLVVLLLARLTPAGAKLPPLLVPKRLGFQQKLMMAFLVVALLPSVVLSIATRDIMRDRSTSRNRDAALAKARAAEAALADLVQRDLEAVRESEYLHDIVTAAESPPVRDIGHLEYSQLMVFRGDGVVILDETLSNLSEAQARAFVQHPVRQIFASRDGNNLCLGTLDRVWFSPTEKRFLNTSAAAAADSAAAAEPYFLFYRRRLTDRLLRNLAPILNSDISAFLGPQLAVSSQKSLATAGLLPSLVPPQAFAHVQLRHNRDAVVEESAGRQRYFAGYLPLEDADGRRIGALAVSQLLQPDEFSVEVERTRQLVLGLSTLMFVLTLVLGVFFASRIFGPVRNLIDGTRRIAGGDLGYRLQARAGDEIGELERSFNDMSARLLTARGALEERRHYLEAVLGNIASGVIATDAAGRITAANPAAYRILHLAPGSLAGETAAQLAATSGGRAMEPFWKRLAEAPGGEVVEIPVFGPAVAAARAAGASAIAPAEATVERLTLRVIVTDLVAEPEPGAPTPPAAHAGAPAGAHLGRVAIFEDVSDLIRSKKLSAWAEMARQVAHEIKNPLTPMKLSAQFMEQAFRDGSDKFPKIFEEGMATIIEQVESLRRIASEFSSFGRAQKLQPQPLDLGELLRGVVAPYATIEGLEVELADGQLGDVRVLGDAEGLRKVFRNVLENAREAMGGRGRIRIGLDPPHADRIAVHITDQGPGISEDAAARLFEPYFSTKSTGTGLGLAISRSIVEELGGTMTLNNRAAGGAEACITLVVC